jgi:spore coat protein U-like protein
LLVSCGVIITPVAQAETVAQFDVTASVLPGCLVDGVGGSGNAGTIGRLDFGVDTTFSSATVRSSLGQALRLRCTPGMTLTMTVDGGRNAAAGTRHLQRNADSSARIAYRLCRDSACDQPIAIGNAALVEVTGTNSPDVRLPIFGALTLSGALPPGTYSDTLTVTLAW